ncbi:MAG: malto-oligosyltrehalose trehalohydrolase [Candidatus Tectomicrobia bacterium]|uniref:Malto-oligosyltrehalose trehalohydrolase n=1 Tax=Tectimicrobiota bacterium TaxID=2528274 RepID=A0A932HYW2_UNCTE|nr:malto-oligosyltrehalose trehalohydrolase [Candidatus Tectomicrobia bacterium]
MSDAHKPLGATCLGDGRCEFCLWAPAVERVEVRLVGPDDRILRLFREENGYHHVIAEGVQPGARYLYRLDGEKERPDPASRFQPEGVHGPSEVTDASFAWTDAGWKGIPLGDYILYELHVGTFSGEGTFGAVIPFLDGLKELGVTAVEIMPVAQFPGERNWGYDGVYPFAVQNSYGGPEGLKRLVDACHARGLAAVLDVVYNHLGPEGNYTRDFSPLYFNPAYHTPWGAALNFDGPGSDEVRRFFIENALYWVRDFRFDALRLDAVHAILDTSARPFLEELGEAVHRQGEAEGRKIYLMPESDQNDPRLVTPREEGGHGLDAVWTDDFHHALHAALTGERGGYYADFGRLADLAKAFREGFVHSGGYSRYRKRRHGRSARHLPAFRHVVCAQNHDQVGNRMRGERLSALVPFEKLKMAAGLVLLSPFLPLLFMGEEYGETAPFLYFVSHTDSGLIEAVRKGRAEEFSSFGWRETPPDPQGEAAFLRSKLQHRLMDEDMHKKLREFHRALIRLRRGSPALSRLRKEDLEIQAFEERKVLLLRRRGGGEEAAAVFHFGESEGSFPLPGGPWTKKLASADARWGGHGTKMADGDIAREGEGLGLPPHSFFLFTKSLA